jgi:hypothetical protein
MIARVVAGAVIALALVSGCSVDRFAQPRLG